MARTSEPAEPEPFAAVVYGGELGENWKPTSARDLWNYAVRTGQVVLPALDVGPDPDFVLNPGERFGIVWVPPEYAGRLVEAPPEPQPKVFTFQEEL